MSATKAKSKNSAPDTIAKHRAVFGASQGVHPSKIYWPQSINEGRYFTRNGVRMLDTESWGQPSKLIPQLGMGWNPTYNVPVCSLEQLPTEASTGHTILIDGLHFVAQCIKERETTLANLKAAVEVAKNSKEKSDVALKQLIDAQNELADYEAMYFDAGEAIEPSLLGFGGFRRASIIHSAAGYWVRAQEGRSYNDYLVSIVVEQPLDDASLHQRILDDNNRLGQQEYSEVSFVRAAKEKYNLAKMNKGILPEGESFRRMVGVPDARRSIWQKIEQIVKIDALHPALDIVGRLVMSVDKDYAYADATSVLPWRSIGGYQAFETLSGKAVERSKVLTHADKTFDFGRIGLAIKQTATDAQVEDYFKLKLTPSEPIPTVSDKSLEDTYIPSITLGKHPVDTGVAIRHPDVLVRLIRALLSRKPDEVNSAITAYATAMGEVVDTPIVDTPPQVG